ncbi:MAG: nucleoside-diphosphate kinase [Myxococcota bacterium]|jgi:nucleoside-diphosphate kinase|nr:nucleoside-diphosphate kinase [Myxococcota bacterium]
MADTQRTLAIVKPDAVAKKAAGQIMARIEESGLEVVGLKRIQLDEEMARGFYAVHKERPFFKDLVEFMTSGPVVVLALEGENAIKRWRDLMGPTNSEEAPAGTMRGDFGTDIERNATHGSDATETARLEIAYFFNAGEIQGLVEALP